MGKNGFDLHPQTVNSPPNPPWSGD